MDSNTQKVLVLMDVIDLIRVEESMDGIELKREFVQELFDGIGSVQELTDGIDLIQEDTDGIGLI